MERQYNNGDFEKLLRDNANQYRMYPSEKVWKGIHSALHTRRKWYGITAAIMFLITGSIVSIIIYNGNPDKNNLGEQPAQKQTSGQIAAADKATQQNYTPAINKHTSGAAKPKIQGVGEIGFNNQAFNLPQDQKDPIVSADQSGEVNAEEAVVPEEAVSILVPVIIETATGEPGNVDPNLVKFNDEVKKENSEVASLTPEDVISGQIGLDPDTENKIREALSALASQNMPLTKANQRPRVTAQVYFTPTVSYRQLSENKRVYNSGAFYVPIIDLNNVVKHKPGMGVEFGIEGRYRVNDKLSIKAGFQFNINRYDIRAYSHTTEVATVALNTASGGFDTLARTTNFRNFSVGANPSWLENFYFQAGVPIGIEIIVSDNKNVQWGVSGTLQPTYVIGDRAYLISSDYKNYARFPDLMRRWNISTGVGTFVSYSTGKVKWQVGPHVRYQHLSSFISALTVKENLFAIGLKVGATLNKQ
jgi:hypothetical protein